MPLAFLGKVSNLRPPFLRSDAADAAVVAEPITRVRVRPKIAYAFAGDAIALSDSPSDLAKLGKKAIADFGFCIDVLNEGETTITVTEVGLAGWFETPQVAVHEPLLHDNKPWPRVLRPGDNVVAHLATSLKTHPILKSLKRAYIRTSDDLVCYGPGGAAMRFYIKQARS